MKKKSIIIIAAIAVLGITGYFVFLRSEEVAISIETTRVKKGDISTVITATGTVEPLTQVEVGTQVSGVIEKLYVDYNSKVKKGQLIAELDKTALKASMAESKASLSSAENELEYQQKNYNRIAQLHEAKTVSDTDYEEALYQLNNAKNTLSQRRSEVNRAQTNLSYASIYSPIDGVVLSKSVDEGQTVAASYSTPTLFTIAQDLTKMQVEADVDEADIGQVKEGQRVTFTVDAYPDDEFTGTVSQVRIEPTEESNVVTYTVIIEAQNPEEKLMPGLTASTTIYTKEVKDVLTVEAKALRFQPEQAVMEAYMNQHQDNKPPLSENIGSEMEGATPLKTAANETPEIPMPASKDDNKDQVWIKEGIMIKPVAVKTGMTDGTTVEILEGLKEGEEVIYSMDANIATTDVEAPGGDAARSPFMPSPPKRR